MKTGRITEAHRTNFTVTENNQEYIATVRGNFHLEGNFPKVGDYVSFSVLGDEKVVIEEVSERSSVIKRRGAEDEEEQIIVTNVDLILIVMGFDGDFNVSRLERYLLLAEQSGVKAVVILNKVDVVTDVTDYLEQVKGVVGETTVLTVSALSGVGMAELSKQITSETTAVLLGSSGAGKSTITNWLLAIEVQAVKTVRNTDNRGRHTTTSRQLFALPAGGYLIDTPGMRELGVVETAAEQEKLVFERIAYFANQCQFNNCDHAKSAGCAVLAAVEVGELTERELKNYHKLQQEKVLLESKGLSVGKRHQVEHQLRQKQKEDEAVRKNR